MTEVGQQFGRWKVLSFSGRSKHGSRLYLCRCDCGEKRIIPSKNLRKGTSKSCGCLRKELSTKHGHARSKTYKIWVGLSNRCNNPNNTHFSRYGARGIKVCKRWNKFENFLLDMGERPAGYSIDRINNNKGYSKNNCRWATPTEQGRNTSRNVNISWEGKIQCLTAWAKELKIKEFTLRGRIRRGWSIERALTT